MTLRLSHASRDADSLHEREDRPDHRRHGRHRQGAAIDIASMGARVGIIGRDGARATEAAAAITHESRNPAVDVFVADLSSQAEVRRVADEVLATYPRLDVLLNNVGGFWAHRHVTADELERTFALNHLAPFLLTDLTPLPTWLGIAGVPIGVALLVGALEFVGPNEERGWALAGTIVPIAYVAWSVWLIALGIGLVL